MIFLEREDHARARGARIYGIVRGYGSVADAFHPSSPEPSGRWEQRAMELALEEAELDPTRSTPSSPTPPGRRRVTRPRSVPSTTSMADAGCR